MLVKKSTLDKTIEHYEAEMAHLNALLEDRERENENLNTEIERLESEVEAYENGVADAESEQTSASFYVSSDLQEVKPVTKVNPDIVNKLVEVGYLSSNKRNDDFSLNLAVLVLVSEALEQIVFSFEQDVDDEDDDGDAPEFSMTRRE